MTIKSTRRRKGRPSSEGEAHLFRVRVDVDWAVADLGGVEHDAGAVQGVLGCLGVDCAGQELVADQRDP